MILFFSLYCFFFVKSINFQVDKAFKQLMTEISTVAKEINSNALIKKHETITSNDLSLSLSSLSLVKPIVSLTSSVSSPIALSEASKSDESKKLDDLDDLELDNNINKFDDKEDKSLFITESNENLTKLNNNNNDDEEEFVRKLIFSLEFYFR